jgi:hypothetical protein
MSSRHRLIAILGVAAILFAAASVASANLASDQITACVNPNGLIFIVDDVAECEQNQTVLAWSTEGSPDPPGTMPGVYVVRQNLVAQPGASQGAHVECDSGDIAVSGGWLAPPPLNVGNDFPNYVLGHAPTGWWTGVENPSESSHSWSAYAICFDTSS